MTELLRIMVLYYSCDMAAAVQPLTPDEAARCIAHYREIKRHFAQGETGPRANVTGYLGFKTWEAENAALVADLRARSAR
ncbi:hypothetical protein [Tateyamaria sp. SN3-11]|uniref:hypothetical protein n=1 Tax=Tateyamaria sp. SN3-11 TaxID=3092147 RepID=UPI0039E7F657